MKFGMTLEMVNLLTAGPNYFYRNIKQVVERANSGDRKAKLVWDAMIYGICKEIGAMAAALQGKVDGILLSGGLSFSVELVEGIRRSCEFIAPVTAYPGEFEMEAMASGALRVLRGEECAKTYTGAPVICDIY